MPMSSSFETRSQVPSSNLWRSPPLTVVTFSNSPALLSARTFEHSLNILNKCSYTGINSANADQRGFGKLVFRQDIRVPPYQCPQTGSPFAHHALSSSWLMCLYGFCCSGSSLVRGRTCDSVVGFCKQLFTFSTTPDAAIN